jgi:hypothetical protein
MNELQRPGIAGGTGSTTPEHATAIPYDWKNKMSHWNYRIVKAPAWLDEFTYSICEVYYDDEGVPMSRTEPVRLFSESDEDGEGLSELWMTIELMRQALEKPILTDDDFTSERGFKDG